MNHKILAIESSCDETSAAVYTTNNGLLAECDNEYR
jgi:tRNA A37 threonylcarbamoyltransferase TsaD